MSNIMVGAFTNVMSIIFEIILYIVVILQIFRICIDVFYIIAPAEFELLVTKQLASDNAKHAKESKKPMTEYLKLIVPALSALFVTLAIVLFGADNLMSAIINMSTTIIEL